MVREWVVVVEMVRLIVMVFAQVLQIMDVDAAH
jgi:hypothetical protein